MSTFDERLHPRATGGQFTTATRSEPTVTLDATPWGRDQARVDTLAHVLQTSRGGIVAERQKITQCFDRGSDQVSFTAFDGDPEHEVVLSFVESPDGSVSQPVVSLARPVNLDLAARYGWTSTRTTVALDGADGDSIHRGLVRARAKGRIDAALERHFDVPKLRAAGGDSGRSISLEVREARPETGEVQFTARLGGETVDIDVNADGKILAANVGTRFGQFHLTEERDLDEVGATLDREVGWAIGEPSPEPRGSRARAEVLFGRVMAGTCRACHAGTVRAHGYGSDDVRCDNTYCTHHAG